jgi:hypothetical protein
VCDGGGHLSERGETFALRELAFEPHVLFDQAIVFERERDLSGQHFQNRAHVRRQSVGRGVNEHQAERLVLTP